MDALGRRREDDRPAAVGRAAHPVDLLAEEEVTLVERADLLERRAPDEHARAHHPLHGALLVVGEATAVEGVQRLRPRRELAEVEVLRRDAPERREAADRALQRPVGVEEPRADDGGARMPRRPRTAAARAASPTSQASALRTRTCSPRVSATPRFQPAASPRFSASTTRTAGNRSRTNATVAVARAVVDDDGVERGDALEAVLDPRQRVVRDDDAGEAPGVSHAPPSPAAPRRAPPPRGGWRPRAGRAPWSRGRRGTRRRTPGRRGRRRSRGS